MDGLVNRRASLTAETPLEITFDGVQNIKLSLITAAAIVAYKVNDEITIITDVASNILNTNIGWDQIDIYKTFGINSLWVISDINCDIQWELRK